MSTASLLPGNSIAVTITPDKTKHPRLHNRQFRQPHNFSHFNSKGYQVIVDGRNLISQPLDGVTPGEPGRDSNGHVLSDAYGNPTIVQTGLYRSIAYDANGSQIIDNKGRLCFLLHSQEQGFNSPPQALDPVIFLSQWHSALQIEYVNKKGTPIGTTGGYQVIIGTTGSQQITAVLSADKKRLYVLETLKKADFGAMSKQDQAIIAETDIFKTKIQADLGLISLNDAKRTNGIYTAIKNYMDSKVVPDYGTINTEQVKRAEENNQNSLYLNNLNVQVFKEQYKMILERIDDSLFIDASVINSERQALQNRYEAAKAFGLGAVDSRNEVIQGGSHYSKFAHHYIRSHDHNRSIKKGFRNLMYSERTILQQKKAARISLTAGYKVDLPNLLASFQLNNYLKLEIGNATNIELVYQTNELISTYTQMQNIINRVAALFTSSGDSSDDPKTFDIARESGGTSTSGGSNVPGNLYNGTASPHGPVDEYTIVCMFNGTPIKRALNPIEILDKITRPTFDNIEEENHRYFFRNQQKTSFDAQATQLSSMLSVLSQKVQLRLNKISSAETKATRSFELANNALGKLHESLLAISRNIG